MDWLTIRRWHQVIKYGWKDSSIISIDANKSRLPIFIDIVSSFSKWHVYSNQYRSNQLWKSSKKEKEENALSIGKENKRRDNWVRENYHNWKFIRKWTDIKYEMSPSLQQKRKRAYTKEFNAGEGLTIQFNVHIHREHYLDGTIKIGKNVLLAKNVFVDYSGVIIIHDNVSIANGVIIETHTHKFDGKKSIAVQGRLEIGDGAAIFSRAYIADTCHSIGRMATIGAGSYVRSNIPPYSIIIGNPAKIVGFSMTPEEIVEFEKANYEEKDRLPFDLLEKNYEKFFLNRWKEIKQWTRI